MDLIEKIDMFTEKTYTVTVNKKVRLMSDDELLRLYRKNPDKEKYLSCAYNCSICIYCWHLSELKKNVFFKYH